MGKYYDWITNHHTEGITGIELVEILKIHGFKYRIIVKDNDDIGNNITNHKEINELTTGKWTGFFAANIGRYMIFFENEQDAATAKLKWT